MPVTYNELRLIRAMIALEHLVSKYGTVPTSTLSNEALALRDQLRDLIQGAQVNISEKSLFITALGRLTDPPLRYKIEALVGKWAVPMMDMPSDAITEIVKARNELTHRGIYYDPAKQNQKDLWDHIFLLNEFLTRLILTALDFSGAYFSYTGGYHQRSFPQCTRI